MTQTCDASPGSTGESGALNRDQLVRDHLHLVGQAVRSLAVRFPRHVDRDELWSAGALGLVEASQRFDPRPGVPFPGYAMVRIKGAILDSTRSRDWAPRSLRRQVREMGHAKSDFAAHNGRKPDHGELARLLGITEAVLAAQQAADLSASVLSLDIDEGDGPSLSITLSDDTLESTPHAALVHKELIGTLREAVSGLPGTHGDVIRRYYLRGELLQTISDDMGVSEARVSQIRAEAIAALRAHFRNVFPGVPGVPDDAPGKRVRAAFAATMAERSNWRSRLDAADESDVPSEPPSEGS